MELRGLCSLKEQAPALQTQAERHPCCSLSMCVNPADLQGLLLEVSLPGSISWIAIKAHKPNVPRGLLIKCKLFPG